MKKKMKKKLNIVFFYINNGYIKILILVADVPCRDQRSCARNEFCHTNHLKNGYGRCIPLRAEKLNEKICNTEGDCSISFNHYCQFEHPILFEKQCVPKRCLNSFYCHSNYECKNHVCEKKELYYVNKLKNCSDSRNCADGWKCYKLGPFSNVGECVPETYCKTNVDCLLFESCDVFHMDGKYGKCVKNEIYYTKFKECTPELDCGPNFYCVIHDFPSQTGFCVLAFCNSTSDCNWMYDCVDGACTLQEDHKSEYNLCEHSIKDLSLVKCIYSNTTKNSAATLVPLRFCKAHHDCSKNQICDFTYTNGYGSCATFSINEQKCQTDNDCPFNNLCRPDIYNNENVCVKNACNYPHECNWNYKCVKIPNSNKRKCVFDESMQRCRKNNHCNSHYYCALNDLPGVGGICRLHRCKSDIDCAQFYKCEYLLLQYRRESVCVPKHFLPAKCLSDSDCDSDEMRCSFLNYFHGYGTCNFLCSNEGKCAKYHYCVNGFCKFNFDEWKTHKNTKDELFIFYN